MVQNQGSIDFIISDLAKKFDIVGTIDLTDKEYPDWASVLREFQKLKKDRYEDNQRIVVILNHDWYDHRYGCGAIIESIQRIVNLVDISNYFVQILSSNTDVSNEIEWLQNHVSTDPVPMHFIQSTGQFTKLSLSNQHRADLARLIELDVTAMETFTKNNYDLLTQNQSFCLAPWTHLFVTPDKKVLPCCVSNYVLGDLTKESLKGIWNKSTLKEIRRDMVQNKRHAACTSCHIAEDSNKKSYRHYINQKLSKHIKKVDLTDNDGTHTQFELNYLHFKFSNLCNLACRTCNPTLSSSWHAVSTELGDIPKNMSPLISANQDGLLYDEFMQHLDNIDLIKFTGGEPLMMQEFYDILDLLIEKQKTNISLFYNTNLMQLRFRGRNILDLWKKFPNVTVGASLDAEGSRGEYIRSFSNWAKIIDNAKDLKKQCPHVYFFVSPTVSILNVLHLPDLHRWLVDQDVIKVSDFDINILYQPEYLNIVQAPDILKNEIQDCYNKHIEWLIKVDKTGRSTSAFDSILQLIQNNRKFDHETFWHNINRLDRYHDTNLLQTFPELGILTKDCDGHPKTRS